MLAILLNGLWQGAFIVAIAYAGALAIPRRNAATRSALWFVTLVVLAVAPVVTTATGLGARLREAFAPHAAASQAFTIALIPAERFSSHENLWAAWLATLLLAAWALGAGIGLLRLAVSFKRMHAIRRSAQPLADVAGAFTSDTVDVPIVAGILRPAIVIPRRLLADLTREDLARIVAHERAHIARNDALWNLVARVVEAALFFNPWARIAGNRLAEEREVACDDWVVARAGNASAYAACLAAIAQSVRAKHAPLLTPSAFHSRPALLSRIERLSSSEPRRLAINFYAIGGTLMLFFAATLALAIFSPALALSPPNIAPGHAFTQIAAACTQPNADASVRYAAEPQMPHGPNGSGKVDVRVTIAADGKVVSTAIVRSSGNAAIDAAVVKAARASTYSPKIANCVPVEGGYIFNVEFKP